MEKSLIRCLSIAAFLGAGCLAAGAQATPEAPRLWLGAWDIELDGASRSCTVTFDTGKAGAGYELRFPATCRRALPILGAAVAWTQMNGRPRLLDASGKDVISFTGGSREAGFDGKGSDGRTYRLAVKARAAATPRATPAAPVIPPSEAARRPTIVDPAKAPAPETLPGRYVLMRQQNREACRLVLSAPPAAGQPGGAAFEGRCQDTGLAIFDPVGWRYVGGRLSLVARRGHSTDLVFENGQWRKDPAVGAPLLMRKLAP